MTPIHKKIMLRYYFIILIMVLVGVAIVLKAGIIMFAERQYWKDFFFTIFDLIRIIFIGLIIIGCVVLYMIDFELY